MKEEFYTQKRWTNWLNKVRESRFKLSDSEDNSSGAVFVYIMDDVVLACLKIIARCERGVISPEEALSELSSIREIVLAEHEPLGEDADLMIESLKTSLSAVFVSCQRYIAGDYDCDIPLAELLKLAVESEKKERLEDTFNILGQVGARVIGGESLPPESMELPYSMTAELLDGIDAISAAMLGDDSYKEDDGTSEEGEEI